MEVYNLDEFQKAFPIDDLWQHVADESWDHPESCGRWRVPSNSLGGGGWGLVLVDGSALSFCRWFVMEIPGWMLKTKFSAARTEGQPEAHTRCVAGCMLSTLHCLGAIVLGIAGCPNQCGRTRVSTAKQEVADIFVCGNTALGCSIYFCHQSRDHPWNEARTLG